MPRWIAPMLIGAVTGVIIAVACAVLFGWFDDNSESAPTTMPPASSTSVDTATDYPYAAFLREAGGTLAYTEGLTGWETWSLESGHEVSVAPRADGTATVNNVQFDADTYQLPGGGTSFSCIPLTEVEVRGLNDLVGEMDLFRQSSLAGKVAYADTEGNGTRTASNGQFQCSIG